MVFLHRIHHKLEAVGERVLLSVTLGEPKLTWPISLVKSAIYFYAVATVVAGV
jgi:hypothetical protein